MIRECFIKQTGIIFDEHMVNQVGLDINSIDKAPEALSSAGRRLSVPEGPSSASAITYPVRWAWNKVPRILAPPPPPKWVFKGEAQEELDDALSPIHDEPEKHADWRLVEWYYCKFPPQAHPRQRR
jgi:hypothetical protein